MYIKKLPRVSQQGTAEQIFFNFQLQLYEKYLVVLELGANITPFILSTKFFSIFFHKIFQSLNFFGFEPDMSVIEFVIYYSM